MTYIENPLHGYIGTRQQWSGSWSFSPGFLFSCSRRDAAWSQRDASDREIVTGWQNPVTPRLLVYGAVSTAEDLPGQFGRRTVNRAVMDCPGSFAAGTSVREFGLQLVCASVFLGGLAAYQFEPIVDTTGEFGTGECDA